ncbi:MAG: glycosyltransferase family 2 protein [Heliobacteriaceae bacterium]|nr:glycosyltransferase family 2 protein [Heliobacteriaceae bacterium]MDD4588298.1 glycosyltransferase family 2 protein [Heliobacteriaceae bacterium]
MAVQLSVVIPAYNEAARLGPTLEKIQAYLGRYYPAYEIIVVDDGSTDTTRELTAGYARTNPRIRCLVNTHNRGKGFSVRRGLLAATGEWVLFSDADLSTPVEETATLLEWGSRGYPVVIGSRALKNSQILQAQPWHRVCLGRLFNGLVQVLAVPGIKDTQCGFKLFDRQTAHLLATRQKLTRFGFDVELLFIARRLGLAVKEAPVRWVDSPDSRVQPFRDGFRMLLDLLRIRWFALSGVYTADSRQLQAGKINKPGL